MMTARQKSILEWVVAFSVRGLPPTYRDIAAVFGISVSTAYQHVAALIDKGYIVKTDGKITTVGKCPLCGDLKHGK